MTIDIEEELNKAVGDIKAMDCSRRIGIEFGFWSEINGERWIYVDKEMID